MFREFKEISHPLKRMGTNDKVSVNDSKLRSRPNFWLLAEIMKRRRGGIGGSYTLTANSPIVDPWTR